MSSSLLKKKLLLLLFAFSIAPFSFSQKEPARMDEPFRSGGNNDLIVSSAAHCGVILIPHHVVSVVKRNAAALELNLIIPTHGKKTWQRNYHYPEMGLTFLVMDFGNPEELGYGYSIYPFVNINLTHGKNFTLKFKFANSIGYITKYFDPVTNPKNLAVGSHFNGFVNLRFNAQLRLTENLRMEMGVGLSHFSNGAMDLPNYGMNVVTGNLGFGYHFNKKSIKLIPDTCSKPKQNWHLVTYLAAGMCGISRYDEAKYFAGVISFNLERFYGSRTKWNTGLEFVYNTARLRETQLDTGIHGYDPKQNVQAGVKVGYAFVCGRIILPLEMGMFLYSKPLDGYFFHRIGVRIQVTDRLILGSTIKTQWARADFFELNLGYSFSLRRKTIGE